MNRREGDRRPEGVEAMRPATIFEVERAICSCQPSFRRCSGTPGRPGPAPESAPLADRNSPEVYPIARQHQSTLLYQALHTIWYTIRASRRDAWQWLSLAQSGGSSWLMLASCD